MRRAARCILLVSAPLLVSCALNDPAWSHMQAGSHVVTFDEGVGDYNAHFDVFGTSGVLTGATGSDSSNLDIKFAANFKYEYYLADNWTIGGLAGYINADADPIAPLGTPITASNIETLRLHLLSRYWFGPLAGAQRLRPFVVLHGLIIPYTHADLAVDYGGGMVENIDTSASTHFGIGGSAGVAYLIADDWAFETGIYAEQTITAAEADVTLHPPGLPPSGLEADVNTDLVAVFFGISFAF
ncbi:MAG: hypothetical protein EYC70_05105 [Planctomycetota bacterium]|nr:MAG: hypothetical protein EYC70_05105 [Planctomycetota bacterium]